MRKPILTTLLIILALAGYGQKTWLQKAGTPESFSIGATYHFYVSTPKGISYMDADSCWHITDTIGTLNLLVKSIKEQGKYNEIRLKSISTAMDKDYNRKIKAANDVLRCFDIRTGGIIDRKKYYKALSNYLKVTGGKLITVKPKIIKQSI